VQQHHPREPHWYLYHLGTEQPRRGAGIGTALMRPVLEQCDRERLPAYLEASSVRNRRLYQRHGFRDLAPLPLPAGGPTLYPMWRDPQ
jgi:GNAT superfamily N-acetyltransferase